MYPDVLTEFYSKEVSAWDFDDHDKDNVLDKIARFECEESMAGCSMKNIHLTLGATHGLYLVLAALRANNSKIIIPMPCYYTPFEVALKLKYDILPLPCSFQDKFLVSITDLENYISDADIILLTNPNFPVLRYYERKELQSIIDIAEEKGKIVIIDEAYINICDLKKGEIRTHPDNNILRVRTFSKQMQLPGLRLGYLIGPGNLIANIRDLDEIITGSLPSYSYKCFDYIFSNLLGRKQNSHLLKSHRYNLDKLMNNSLQCQKMLNEFDLDFIPPDEPFILQPFFPHLAYDSQTTFDLVTKLIWKKDIFTYFGGLCRFSRQNSLSIRISMGFEEVNLVSKLNDVLIALDKH